MKPLPSTRSPSLLDLIRVAALAAVVAGCGATSGLGGNFGSGDGGADLAPGSGADAAAADAAMSEAGSDGATVAGDVSGADAGLVFDAIGPEAGPTDAGPLDAGPFDSGSIDSAQFDATGLDAGATDAAAADASATDGFKTDGFKSDAAQPDVASNKCAVGGAPCAKGQYCATPSGACFGVGVCIAFPGVCDSVYDPVCGCDGKTYGNACEAAVSGANIASVGACTNSGSCGGFAGIPCAKGQFCDPSGCGADMTGMCVAIPSGCPKNLAPVCGCDGVTYGNDCMRQVAGVGKASDGPCPTSGTCDVGDNTGCGKSQFCQASAGGGCSGVGSCEAIPMICPMLYKPVCGCDGKDYGNDCEAHGGGTNVASAGACPSPPPGGCVTTKDCPSGLACKSGVCGTCIGIMCTAIACPPGQTKDQCCNCYTP